MTQNLVCSPSSWRGTIACTRHVDTPPTPWKDFWRWRGTEHVCKRASATYAVERMESPHPVSMITRGPTHDAAAGDAGLLSMRTLKGGRGPDLCTMDHETSDESWMRTNSSCPTTDVGSLFNHEVGPVTLKSTTRWSKMRASPDDHDTGIGNRDWSISG